MITHIQPKRKEYMSTYMHATCVNVEKEFKKEAIFILEILSNLSLSFSLS